MSENQEKDTKAMRIFEALSSVDEELLERSEKNNNVIPFVRYNKVLVACACFMIVAGITWYSGRILMTGESYESATVENCMIADGTGDDQEEAALEDIVVEDVVEEEAENDMDMPESVITESGNSNKAEQSMSDSAPLAPKEEILSEAEVRSIEELGKYVPDSIPAGYVFENSSKTEDGSIYIRWSKGMDDIVITVEYYKPDAEKEKRIVEISKPETYDVHRYEIPYADSVPREYRETFNDPIFLEKDVTEEVISTRIKSVSDAGDTDTPRGNFSVLYESGVLVSFRGDCRPEYVVEMFQTIGE